MSLLLAFGIISLAIFLYISTLNFGAFNMAGGESWDVILEMGGGEN